MPITLEGLLNDAVSYGKNDDGSIDLDRVPRLDIRRLYGQRPISPTTTPTITHSPQRYPHSPLSPANTMPEIFAQEQRYKADRNLRVRTEAKRSIGTGSNSGTKSTPCSSFSVLFLLLLLIIGLCDLFLFLPLLLLLLLPSLFLQSAHLNTGSIDLTLTCHDMSTMLHHIILLLKQTQKIVDYAQIEQFKKFNENSGS
jgi:hypothetical protein